MCYGSWTVVHRYLFSVRAYFVLKQDKSQGCLINRDLTIDEGTWLPNPRKDWAKLRSKGPFPLSGWSWHEIYWILAITCCNIVSTYPFLLDFQLQIEADTKFSKKKRFQLRNRSFDFEFDFNLTLVLADRNTDLPNSKRFVWETIWGTVYIL